jgi:hypothetical protein
VRRLLNSTSYRLFSAPSLVRITKSFDTYRNHYQPLYSTTSNKPITFSKEILGGECDVVYPELIQCKGTSDISLNSQQTKVLLLHATPAKYFLLILRRLQLTSHGEAERPLFVTSKCYIPLKITSGRNSVVFRVCEITQLCVKSVQKSDFGLVIYE